MAPPQMCHSQSHHVTLGVTIGRSPRGEGPDRHTESGDLERETHWEDSRAPPAAELVGGGSNSTGARQRRRARNGESGTLGSKVGLYTHTQTHDPSYNLHVIIDHYCNTYTLF